MFVEFVVFNPADCLALASCFEPSFPRSEEANHVLDAGVVKLNDNERTVVNELRGFACCSAVDSMAFFKPSGFIVPKWKRGIHPFTSL